MGGIEDRLGAEMKSLAPPGQRDTDTGGTRSCLGRLEDQTWTSLPGAGVSTEGGTPNQHGGGQVRGQEKTQIGASPENKNKTMKDL